jgi:hypothetical protein
VFKRVSTGATPFHLYFDARTLFGVTLNKRNTSNSAWMLFWLKASPYQPNAVTGLESAAKNNGYWLVRMKEWLGDYDCMPSCAALFTEAKISDSTMKMDNDG